MTNYQLAKNDLKAISLEAKANYPNDKPAIRMIINDSVQYLSIEYRLHEHQIFKLSDYACKLHPKN